ncbi:hypothetical protein EVG20_g2767 [Dentipellis fragilis]|uniref:Inactive metallocarboxypeptidase ECM14 n=1 Tax=Dentipellis fragilis TaxID=205917 RepID=A0A4Y9Z7Z5_9AGAM|nr:hypothetical protein EVG20_g2767 [Dentipellis fragilis]
MYVSSAASTYSAEAGPPAGDPASGGSNPYPCSQPTSMHLRLRLHPLSLFLLLVPASSLALVLAHEAQHPLQNQNADAKSSAPGPVLRHYGVRSAREAEDVLALAERAAAQDNGWDVWHATPAGVDVFFPTVASINISQHTTQNENAAHQYDFHDTPYTYGCSPPSSPAGPGAAEDAPWNLTGISLANATFHAAYHTLVGIDAFVGALADGYPQQVTLVQLGHSGEGREMYAVEIQGVGELGSGSGSASGEEEGGGGGEKREMGFVVTGAQHAREWVATAASLYLAHALVANASEPGSLAYLLKDYKFYIVPVPNPDGYLYTWEHDRFW